MGRRREARERAVQFLFQFDLNPPANLDEALNQFWESQLGPAIAEEKGPAAWGEKTKAPPPTADEAAVRADATSSDSSTNTTIGATEPNRLHTCAVSQSSSKNPIK